MFDSFEQAWEGKVAPGGQIVSWGGKQVGELELNPEDQLETGKENATGAEQGSNGKRTF